LRGNDKSREGIVSRAQPHTLERRQQNTRVPVLREQEGNEGTYPYLLTTPVRTTHKNGESELRRETKHTHHTNKQNKQARQNKHDKLAKANKRGKQARQTNRVNKHDKQGRQTNGANKHDKQTKANKHDKQK
jgi:hypothetical protein